jgi:hypothetical protein
VCLQQQSHLQQPGNDTKEQTELETLNLGRNTFFLFLPEFASVVSFHTQTLGTPKNWHSTKGKQIVSDHLKYEQKQPHRNNPTIELGIIDNENLHQNHRLLLFAVKSALVT